MPCLICKAESCKDLLCPTCKAKFDGATAALQSDGQPRSEDLDFFTVLNAGIQDRRSSDVAAIAAVLQGKSKT